ncbi:MAG: tRNA (guanine(26)-N(2))-dimethyltransferase [Nanoarchaeota archaeon]|nr:tRNA (guanine(26)-N(2))-dimethyltransferase [Nanoarchaeota archaeon]MBU1854892.1 tRNA (guanine(26)-N(2))-dimethyltransferase [Nanoarchaeota archaeon]
MFQTIQEGKALIKVSVDSKISKKLPIFYNPVMKFNRDISILLLNSIRKSNMQLALPLSGSGIRGVRFLLELKKRKIKNISFNDYKEDFLDMMNDNLRINNIRSSDKIIIFNLDANLFLLNALGFDYIDIDPFGSPNPFLDSAVKRLARKGVLAVTATDTSALCGTYEDACKRKYWAVPLRNELQHEIGLRILIRKVQLIGSQFEKALIPIFSYSKDHYMRVFFKCEKGKKKVDKVINQHFMFGDAGPIWIGDLWDKKLVNKMFLDSDGEVKKFLNIIKEECNIKTIGFHDIHDICKQHKLMVPKYEVLMNKIKKKGHKVSRTHLSGFGIKSDIGKEEILSLLK